MAPSASLDNWRNYFRRGDSDIFGIIDHAIMVAAADCPDEFKSRRSKIAELLFSCKATRCIGCDHLELTVADEEGANNGRRTVDTVGGGDRDESGVATDNQIVSNQSYGEASVIVDEVTKIKDILLNNEYEPCSVLLESLRKLESMSMSIDILKDTEIGKAVNDLKRHHSDKIKELAKTLFAEWQELMDQWVYTPKEITGAEGTPESAFFSIVDEEEAFPSPPHDLDIFAPPDSSGFELSQILDCLDCDGNLRHDVESKHERKQQSSFRRRPEVTNEANVVKRFNKDQQMRKEVDVRPIKHSSTDFDEPRRQMEPAIQRKPLDADQKRKHQQDKLKAMDPDAKFEFAKRKLQESYQKHENAKRQRTIQVLETIPKQIKPEKSQPKRPFRRYFHFS